MTEEFDPEAFMNESIEAEGDTIGVQLPDGDYPAIIEKVIEPRAFQGKKDPSKTYVSMNIVYSVTGQPINAELEQEKISVRQNIFLDLKGGRLDMGKGKNVALNNVRAAVNQNNANAWNFRMLEGQGPVQIKVKSRDDQNGVPRAEVVRVGTLD